MSTVEDGRRLDAKYVLAGTPETVVERIGKFIDEGCSNLVLEAIPRGPSWDRQIERLIELLPSVRDRASTSTLDVHQDIG